MDIVKGIFETLGEIVSEFVTLLVSIFENVVKLFWTPAAGEGAGGQLTVLGVFLLIGLGTSLVIWGFNFIRSLIRIRRG